MAGTPKIIRPHSGFQEKFVRTNVDVCIAGGVLNCGKAQPLYSRILTPNGWVRMEYISVGDTICDSEGGIQTVEAVYERGLLECKEVVFDDGSVVKCCPEHLWYVFNENTGVYETLELRDIMKDPKAYSVDLPKAVAFKGHSEKVIPSYVLGTIIGNPYDLKNEPILTSVFKPEITEALKGMSLYLKDAKDIFIPTEYLYTSVEERTELLEGILISFGHYGTLNGRIKYHTFSEQFAKDITFLVRSLGGKVLVKETTDIHKKKIFYFDFIFKKLRSKKDRVSLKFKNINSCKDEVMRCIKVSNPNHLYITDDFVVTHNTAGAVLMCAEPSLDPNFRAVFLRNNLGDLKSGGGILDEFKSMYRGGVNVAESGDPHIDFPSGSRIDVTHIADQSRDKVRQRFKGRQYDLIYFDEMTGFTWECFTEVCTRNRGRAKWTGKIRGTTNPDKNHWLRTFLDWYIGLDGFIREDREGVVRYFYVAGETVKDVVWGDTKHDVYMQCKIEIDRKLAKVNGRNGKATYEDMIRSFTFYLGRMSENTDSIGNNSGYVGAVAMSGGRNAEQLLEGNWNVSPNESLDAPIPMHSANQVFLSEPQMNGDKWITCDLADTGTDNFLAIAWDGFHAIDILILGRTTPRQNAEELLLFAAKHDIANDHIIYDAIRGTYINDYIREAVPFVSYRAPMGMYSRMAYNLKAECYLRLVELINKEKLSFSDELGNKIYEHQNLKSAITVRNEFLEECAVVRFKDMQSGKKALLSKREMNAKLGKNRSMDLLDPCAMRMYPVLQYAYGEELEKTIAYRDTNDELGFGRDKVNLFDNSFFGVV